MGAVLFLPYVDPREHFEPGSPLPVPWLGLEVMREFGAHELTVFYEPAVDSYTFWSWIARLFGLRGGQWRCVAGFPRYTEGNDYYFFQRRPELNTPAASDLDANGACRCGCGFRSSWQRNQTDLRGDANGSETL